jgi:hypothetical protein
MDAFGNVISLKIASSAYFMSSEKYIFSNIFLLKTLLQHDGKRLILLIFDNESFTYIFFVL